MTFGKLIPWNRKTLPAKLEGSDHPIYSMQKEMDWFFDNFFKGYENGFPSLTGEDTKNLLSPSVDLSETDEEVILSMELPGISEEDIEVNISQDVLTVSGEKKQETEENEKGWYRMERHYGSFKRAIPLPVEPDLENVDASFKNGVLTVKMPKTEADKPTAKHIEVKKG